MNLAVAIFGVLFWGFTSIILNLKKTEISEKEESNKSKEEIIKEKKDEIKKKSVDTIIANSPEPESIKSGIKQQQQEFRNRVTDRLKQSIQSFGSQTDN